MVQQLTMIMESATLDVKLAAHRELVDAILTTNRTPEPRSHFRLWQRAVAEQCKLGRDREAAEHSLELLTTEIRALAKKTVWFREDANAREHAITETIKYWATDAATTSRAAHLIWRRYWDSQLNLTHNLITDFAELAAAVAAEQRIERSWAARWQAWADRLFEKQFNVEPAVLG